MKTITKFKWISVILLLSVSMQLFAQSSTPGDYYNRLFYLCKAWGHAKYFHTEIAKGDINWDDQLLTAIESVKAATSDDQFNEVLLQMLNSASPMGTSTVPLPDVSDDLNLNNDHSWMDNAIFSAEVNLMLHEILDKFRPQSNYYVGRAYVNGNPTFDSDNQYYTSENYPSEGLRLLGLFRYWNIYNYFFPYKKLMDINWDASLAEFIPKIAESEDEIDFHLNFKELTTRINDSHAGLTSTVVYSNLYGGCYPPFLTRFIDNEMVITKILEEETTFAVGDIIKEIDGLDIYELRSSLRIYAGGSNEPAIEKSINNLIMMGEEGESQITVTNGTNTHTESFFRDYSNYSNLLVDNAAIWRTTIFNSCTFGIVDMARLEVADVAPMFSDLWNTQAIVFDIRNYPRGTLWTIVNYLFPGPIHIADFTTPAINYPGTLYWHSTNIGSGTTAPYSGKVILLFNERTISQAEYTIMGLELFPDAIKIGSTTAGADGNVSKLYLSGNISASMTGLGTFYSDRTPTQRVGIIPDYEVHPTIQGIREGRDELMEFALNCALLNVHPDYCSSFGKATKEWIASVSLGTNSNPSGSSATIGYENFESPVFTVESGKSYSIQLLPGYIKAALEYWAVWIDFDGDQGFDEPGELVFSKNKSRTSVSGTIMIPAGLSLTTRMRVSMSNSSGPNELAIYSLEGKLMHKALITSNLSSIDVSSWTKGIYFIEINNKKGRVTKKIIIR